MGSRISRPNNDVYRYCCMEITLGEQLQIFGTIGLDNILKKYTEYDAIAMVKSWLDSKQFKQLKAKLAEELKGL